MTVRSKVSLLLALAAFVAVVYVGYLFMQHFRRAGGYVEVSRGMNEAAVIDAMGSPDRRDAGCRDAPSWDGVRVTETRCALQFIYQDPLAPRFWAVGFDDRGLVMAKADYISP